jgi:hypothetical protein
MRFAFKNGARSCAGRIFPRNKPLFWTQPFQAKPTSKPPRQSLPVKWLKKFWNIYRDSTGESGEFKSNAKMENGTPTVDQEGTNSKGQTGKKNVTTKVKDGTATRTVATTDSEGKTKTRTSSATPDMPKAD